MPFFLRERSEVINSSISPIMASVLSSEHILRTMKESCVVF